MEDDCDFMYLTEENIESIKANNNGCIDLSKILSLVDLELKLLSDNTLTVDDFIHPKFDDAYQKLLVDVQGNLLERIIYSVVLRARRLRFYQDLSPQDKFKYDSELDSHFIRAAVPIPLQNARKLIALIKAGILSTVQLGYSKNNFDFSEIVIGSTKITPDIVILSNGQNYDIKNHPSIFIKKLIGRGEIVAHDEDGYLTGGIGANEATGFRVANVLEGGVKNQCTYSQNLYSFGPITQYWQNQNNYAAAFVNAAQITASEWGSLLGTFTNLRM